ncbi:terminase small subunit [Mycobacterium phage OhShagHennessy]|uniref:Terminase small subunit n=1 Tax=Mycobacterium phage OhShagHennessy TaxID=2801895 RepID=A0A7U0GCK2_9CAUD|nr:terminase small subunit [Mycobacterium phage OhShagHennessy]ASR85985.1 terminase small subunit [Mycobacterium phage Appletree2]QQV92705.1 terminase small subunit [Mycobacterium phage OhShagHennessy]
MRDDSVPSGLMAAGKELWESVASERELDAPSRVLLLNACRIADRLDQLDQEIDGRLLSYNQRGDEVINPLISEHRQQYTTLANILGKMGLGELPKAKQENSRWDELAKKRAERAAKAAQAS